MMLCYSSCAIKRTGETVDLIKSIFIKADPTTRTMTLERISGDGTITVTGYKGLTVQPPEETHFCND